MENIDVCELKGEKEDLEKKLKEKEEMEQKYHDLLSSLKYVIQSGATQQKEAIPQVLVTKISIKNSLYLKYIHIFKSHIIHKL